MEITRDTMDWSDEDQLKWQGFLSTQTGGRLLPKLIETTAPQLLRAGDSNEILIRNGESLGFQDAIKGLLFLASPPPKPIVTETHYPNLADDAAWQDGQKIQ